MVMSEILNNMNKTYILILFGLLIASCSSKNRVDTVSKSTASLALQTVDSVYIAGRNITLIANISAKDTSSIIPDLILTNSYGTIIVSGQVSIDVVKYILPGIITNRAGLCEWRLVSDGQVLKNGTTTIIPNISKENNIESYLGPRSITAGDIDYSMLVNVPIDFYDNPLLDDTAIEVTHHFENNFTKEVIKTQDLLGWINIGSTRKSGRILVTSKSTGAKLKELTTIVHPSNAIDFTIDYQRNHKYADGNQIITFKTSTLKDEFDNIVSDGTYVTFRIIDSKGSQLQAVGLTIGGIATAKMLHPDEEELWTIKAFVTGAAKSNSISIPFVAGIEDYTVQFLEGNRTIVVGPMTSFMDQLAPDGLLVRLAIYNQDNILVETKALTLQSGEVTFLLTTDFYESGNYHIEIKSAGIVKKYNLKLDGKTHQ